LDNGGTDNRSADDFDPTIDSTESDS
jgi:hypothetical protein